MSGLLKPCLSCGTPSPASRCDEHKLKRNRSERNGHIRNTSKWKRISTRVRTAMPFCLDCNTDKNLTTDHIVPVSVAPELAYEILNLTTRCRSCNSKRGTNYLEAEEQAVRDAIAARKERMQRYYLAQQ